MRGVERVFHVAGTAELVGLAGADLLGQRRGDADRARGGAAGRGASGSCYTSSVAAIGPAPPGQSADETTPWEAGRYRIAYLDAKHEAETAALRLVARGLPLVIVNPATRPRRRAIRGRSSTALVRRFMRRQIPAYVDGTLNVVGVQDVARGHLLADERGRVGERYILGNRNFTLDRLFADLGRLSGIEPPAIKLPLRSPGAGRGRPAGRRPGAAEPDRDPGAVANWAFVNRKARRELGWRPSPHEDCLEETVAWYRERDGAGVAGRRARASRWPLARGRRRAAHGPGSERSDQVATLYRCTTPTDWLCPCGKVARALRRDGIEFETVAVPQRRSRRPEVEALSGQRGCRR